MFLFKSKKPIEPKKEAEQVNVDLELVTKMNQDFALSLDLNDTLMNALRVIIARLNAEAANIFLINEQKKKFECIASLHQDYLDEYELDLKDGVMGKANNNLTIIINKDVDPSRTQDVIDHEMVHIDQMKRGDLNYDDDYVYWKGKKYSRKDMDEGNKTLPWEAEAYKKS